MQCRTPEALGLSLVLFISVLRSGEANNITEPGCNTTSADVATSLTFAPFTSVDLLPFYPHRLTSPGWENISDVLGCARETLRHSAASRGFLYNSHSGLCTPLLWLEGPAAPDARGAEPSEGTVHLVPDLCANGFGLYQYSSIGELACLRDFNSSLKYRDASAVCQALGGVLASVKTAEKLALIQHLSQGQSRWVGMDDLDVEGTFVWQLDKTTLTAAQQGAVFKANEPNNNRGVEDCIQFRDRTQKLNDVSCGKRLPFVCEIPLPGVVTC